MPVLGEQESPACPALGAGGTSTATSTSTINPPSITHDGATIKQSP